jgi:hypothetical protein
MQLGLEVVDIVLGDGQLVLSVLQPCTGIIKEVGLDITATPSTSVTQPLYGMLLNYFGGQTPPAYNTSMTLYTSESVPISTIPPTSAIPGHTSFLPLLAPMGVGSNATAGVRNTTPHALQPPPPIV